MLQSRATACLATAVALVLLASAGFVSLVRDPEGAFLPADTGAPWISRDAPTRLKAHPEAPQLSGFRTRLRVGRPPDEAPLHLRSLGAVRVELDDRVLFTDDAEPVGPVRERQVELSPHLSQGDHVLVVKVVNRLGPPLLSAHAPALGLRSGTHWEATADGERWQPARLAAAGVPPAALSRAFPHAGRAFAGRLVALAPIFALAAAASLGWGALAPPAVARLGRLRPSASGLRWLLLAAWALLAANNIGKLSPHLGMDVHMHVDYIRYLVEERSIPLATQGGEMMQSPLYYLISAPFYALFSAHFAPEAVVRLLRIVPFACGIAQVEICYRALRAAFPARQDLQMLGLLVGGLLPMNLALSQAVANEPMAGLMGGTVVALLLALLRAPRPPSLRALAALGLACGLALLSKVSAVLLGPAVLYAVVVAGSRGDAPRARVVRGLAVVGGVAFAVCGWYYLRNWMLMGAPFVGTWEASLEEVWWQEPGYRTASQFLRFGEALSHPFFSAVVSVWDGLYASLWLDGYLSGQTLYVARPPWNFSFMLAGAWLALLPTLLIAVGFARGWMPLARAADGVAQRGLRLSAICVATYLAAILYMNLTIPFYCVAKASYMAAATPALAVLTAGGAEPLTRHPVPRALAVAALSCFALSAYAAFFVL